MKYGSIGERVDKLNQNKKLFQLRHHEIETLKFQDQNENNNAIKASKFKEDMKRDQKAIALTLMNNDRRQYMTSANDKLRCTMAREKLHILK